MNKLLKILLGTTLLTAFGSTMAQCPSNLDANQMYDCIVVEGAGDEYQLPAKSATSTDETKQADAKAQDDDVKLAHNSDEN